MAEEELSGMVAPSTDPEHVADLLDRIPGAFERAELGLAQARAGDSVLLDEVAGMLGPLA